MKLFLRWAAMATGAILVAGSSLVAHADPSDPVSIPDPGLRSCMARAIGVVAAPSFTEEQIAGIRTLDCRDVGSLAGLEHAPGLIALSIYRGEVSDLSPLRTSALTSILLGDTAVTDLGPLASAAQLERIYINNSRLADLRPLAGLTKLSEVSITNCAISDLSPLSTWRLSTLALQANQITDLGPLARMTSLRDLNLSANAITDITPLGGLRNLQRLELDDNKVVDVGPLARLPRLDAVLVSNNEVSNAAPLSSAHRRGAGIILDGNRVADLRAFNALDREYLRLAVRRQNFRSSVRAQAGVPAEVPAYGASAVQPMTLTLPAGVTRSGSRLLYRSPGTFTIGFSQETEMVDVEIPNPFLFEYFSGTFTQTVTAATGIASATPKISGTSRVGSRLVAATGSWYPTGVVRKYQWLRGNKAIPKATASTYTPKASDRGKRIAVSVTGTYPRLPSVTRTSLPTAKVGAGILRARTPVIVGVARTGEKLRAVTKPWAPAPVRLTYRWLRNGSAIKGATKSSYTLAKKDKAKLISVRVTGRKAGYVRASRTSAPAPRVR